MQKTWFITGASRGLGAQIAKTAIRAGDRVVATARRREAVIEGLGPDSNQLLSVGLDVVDGGQARAAVRTALARFGTIDVLVNNARCGYLGFFEENAIQDTQAQFTTNLFGVFNLTWAVLPTLRFARTGRIFNISSFGGVPGAELGPLYSAGKFALECFSQCLSKEIARFGLSVTIVEPGREQRNGHHPVADARLAQAIANLVDEAEPPTRFFAGSVGLDPEQVRLADAQAELAVGAGFP